MGFAITWFAFRDVRLSEAAAAFDLEQTGQSEEVFDFEFNGAETPQGWSVIIFNEFKEDFPTREMRRLSTGREMVLVGVEEHVMLQRAELWHDGRRVWSIEHSGERGVRHLEARGDLPAFFEEVRGARFAEQDREDSGAQEVDYISEIPVEVAERMTGFRHDVTALEFLELAPRHGSATLPARSFLSRLAALFGRT